MTHSNFKKEADDFAAKYNFVEILDGYDKRIHTFAISTTQKEDVQAMLKAMYKSVDAFLGDDPAILRKPLTLTYVDTDKDEIIDFEKANGAQIRCRVGRVDGAEPGPDVCLKAECEHMHFIGENCNDDN